MKKKFLGIICLIYSFLIMYVYFRKYLGNFLAAGMQKYIMISSPILLIMGIVLIVDKHSEKFKFTDAVLLLPIVMLFFAQDGRLTTALASNRVTSFKSKEVKEEIIEEVEDIEQIEEVEEVEYDFENVDYDIVDEAYAALTDIIAYNKDLNKFIGKTVRIKGFTLINTPGIPKGYFAIGKYVVSCCAADASFGGFISKYEGDLKIEESKWYEVEGVLESSLDVNGYDIIIINVKNIKEIDGSKEEIYVYPCYSYDNGQCNVLKKYDLGF